MYRGGIEDYTVLEEDLNILLADEKIRRLRNAAVDFVKLRLEKRVLARMRDAGISEALEQGYICEDQAQTKTFYSLLSAHKDAAKPLGLSQQKIRQIRLVAAAKKDSESEAREARENALQTLREILLKEEMIRFSQEAKIAPKVWRDFLNCDKLTGEPTLEKIRSALKLTDQEYGELKSHVIVHIFPVNEKLRKKANSLRKQTGMNLTEFQNYACIGKEAWEAFYTLEEETLQKRKEENRSPEKKISQKTLLKLVIGFGLDEKGAWEFMETAHSVFAVRMDLVFLACVRCDCADPIQVQEILDFFAVDEAGNLYYTNPYD